MQYATVDIISLPITVSLLRAHMQGSDDKHMVERWHIYCRKLRKCVSLFYKKRKKRNKEKVPDYKRKNFFCTFIFHYISSGMSGFACFSFVSLSKASPGFCYYLSQCIHNTLTGNYWRILQAKCKYGTWGASNSHWTIDKLHKRKRVLQLQLAKCITTTFWLLYY